jgi:hypothetical protein
VRFELAIDNPLLSAHEGLRVSCRLRNDDPQPLDIPSPYDRSGAFRVALFDGEQPVRVMSRLTRQRMMTDGRADGSLDTDTLEPGAEWNWRIDLASYHYPIPPGQFLLDAIYEYPPAGLRLRSGPHPIQVQDDSLAAVSALRDNPVLDGVTLLLEAEGENGTGYFLRQHNYGRPVGAWYSSRILAGEEAEEPFCASAAFFQTETPDPFLQKWVLWTKDAELRARRYDRGLPSELARAAPLPEDRSLVRSALRTAADELLVFMWAEPGRLECYRFAGGLTKLFEHRVRGVAAQIAVSGDDASIHLAVPWRGILYDRLSFDGKLLDRFHVFRSRLAAAWLAPDGVGRFKALFRDGPHGKTVQMAVVDIARDTASECRIDRVGIHDDLNELSFDQDSKGRFHLLVSTAGGKLYYLFEGSGPRLIAEGESRYFPIVVAPLRVYLGCYRRECGYRFLQFRKRRRGPKLLGLDPHG